MRLLELSLLSYGPFSEEVLAFGDDPALEVVYGPNEAGKSTALRAITGFFYGIPEKTGDDHLHEKARLRIGGRLRDARGEVLAAIRRKGRKDTLLDPHNRPLDEAVMQRALGGVSRELFLTMFGLDHRTLAEGAQALLRGEGHVGESLFDAGGARGVGDVLARLREEADALFKPRGTTPKLNEALREHKDAKQRIVLKETLPRGYLDQKQRQRDAQESLATRLTRRQEIGIERSRLERSLRVRPHLARRRELLEGRARLGEVPRLPDDAEQRRLDAQRQLDACERDAARLEREIAEHDAELALLIDQPELAELDSRQVAAIRDRLVIVRKAAVDLPKRQGELSQHEREIAHLLGRLGREGDPSRLLVDRALEARIDKLARSHERLVTDLARVDAELEEQRVALADAKARCRAIPPSNPHLRAPLKRALAAGDLDADVRAAEAAASVLAARVERERRGLPEAQAFPARETIDAHERAIAALALEEERLAERRATLAADAERITQALDEIERRGEVPSAAQLERARARRDALWSALLSQGGPDALSDRSDEYQAALREADALADRLWREADRVAQRARLEAESAACERARRALEQNDLTERASTARREWNAIFPKLGIDPVSPTELRRLAEQQERALVLAAEWDEARARHDFLVERRRELGDALRAVLPEAGPHEELGPLVDEAEHVADELASKDAERRALERRIAELELVIRQRESQRAKSAEALANWQHEWTECMVRLGFGPSALVEEASAYLADLRELASSLRDAEQLRGRIAAIERDAAQFERDVASLARRCLPGVEGAAEGLADELVRAHERARQVRQARDRLAGAIRDKQEELAGVRRRHADAATMLAELMRTAHAGTLEELEAAERRWRELATLERELLVEEERLFEAGEGARLDELEALTRDLDVDQVKARLDELASEHRELDEAIDELNREIGGARHGLEMLEQREGAFGAAQDAQASLATIGKLTERYVRARLAIRLLEQEIERYRQENQGPIVARASELFPRLTLGAYRELIVDYRGKDEPELRCLRADGRDVGVEALSDGTRDQLYLALRLASLERHADRSEPLPFVVDDILVHFDEDRARAALSVLSDFSRTSQVLFFTHSERLLELAREVVPPERLREHRLCR